MQIPTKTPPAILNTNSQDSSDDEEDESKRTVFCNNLTDQVTEELLYELFLQTGPIESVRIPKDKDGRQRTFAFVTFAHSISVPYALELLAGVKLFNRELMTKRRTVNSNNNLSQSYNQSNTPPPQARPLMRFSVGDIENGRDRQTGYNNNNNSNTLRFGSTPIHSGIDMNMRPQERIPRENDRGKSNSVDSLLAQLHAGIHSPFNSFSDHMMPKQSHSRRQDNKPYNNHRKSDGHSSGSNNRNHRRGDNSSDHRYRR